MFYITLRMARENCRMTEKAAAEKAGIQIRTLRRWEKDCSRAESRKVFRLLKVYGLSPNHVYFGPEDEVLNQFKSGVKMS